MELVAIGKISKPIGVSGEVKIVPFTIDTKRFLELKSVWVGDDPVSAQESKVVATKIKVKNVILHLSGVDNLVTARELQNKFVYVLRDQVIKPSTGSYFIDDIIGCEVWTEENAFVGVIEDLYYLPASDVWIAKNGTKEILIPAVEAIVKKVDTNNKRITIKALEGLFD